MEYIKIIKTIEQYHKYCDELERLTSIENASIEIDDKIDLLTFLIETWDKEHIKESKINPVQMLRHLMEMRDLNATKLSVNTGIDNTIISKILNYKKGFSKEIIRILSNYFKVRQDIFNQPYELNNSKTNKVDSKRPKVNKKKVEKMK